MTQAPWEFGLSVEDPSISAEEARCIHQSLDSQLKIHSSAQESHCNQAISLKIQSIWAEKSHCSYSWRERESFAGLLLALSGLCSLGCKPTSWCLGMKGWRVFPLKVKETRNSLTDTPRSFSPRCSGSSHVDNGNHHKLSTIIPVKK